jgi:hypothetical protein
MESSPQWTLAPQSMTFQPHHRHTANDKKKTLESKGEGG